MEKGKYRVPFWVIVILIMTLTIGVSVGTTALLIRRDTVEAGRKSIQHQILRVATSTARLATVKRTIAASNAGSSANVQAYIKRLNRHEQTDFIVVLNRHLIRLSHPKASEVGKPFSSSRDPQPALKGRTHFSEKAGVLGPEYRVFQPVRNAQGTVIGVVCVGITQRNLDDQLRRQTKPILIGGLIGILVGGLLALILSLYLRYLLLGMTPNEIAEKTTRQALIDDALPEGIIAINQQGRILTANQAAQRLFGQALTQWSPLEPELKALLFAVPAVLAVDAAGTEVEYQDKQLLVTVNPLLVRHRNIGQVALIRDMSEMAGLIDKLSGTEHYISSLRAQTHEFMNQLQVINGLLELEEYPRALQFIQQVTNTYHQEVGHVSDHLKWPAMVGLILGKSKEAKEQRVQLIVDEASSVPQVDLSNQTEVLILRIVSNLLDNAISACQPLPEATGQVTLLMRLLAASGQLEVVVTDNGSGLSSTVRQQMFTQGYSTKGPHRGYGMGLIAAAVKTLDGTLDIRAEQPHGTQIRVVVTIQEESTKNENINH